MSKRKCGLCGKDPAAGFASINDTFYCHGDFDPEPTCYMASQGAYVVDAVVGRLATREPREPQNPDSPGVAYERGAA